MTLDTGRLLSTPKVTKLPVTDLVIQAVEEMAYAQGFEDLKFTNRNGLTLHDPHWIAGVDYEAADEDEEGENENDDDPSDSDDDDADDDDGDDDDGQDPDEPGPGPEDIGPFDFEGNEDDDPAPATETASIDSGADEDGDYVEDEDEADEDEDVSDEDDEAAGSDEDGGDEDDASVPRRSSRVSTRTEVFSPEMHGKSHRTRTLLTVERRKKPKRWVNRKRQRTRVVRFKMEESHYNLKITQPKNKKKGREYTMTEALILIQFVQHLESPSGKKNGLSFGQQYMLQKGLKVFGESGKTAAMSEIRQQHDRKCFAPRSISEMTESERKKAQEALMFLTEKRSGEKKGRMVYNGKPTREWLSKEDSASPTATLEGIMVTVTIDAKEGRDNMTADVPNAFIQTEMPKVKDGEERVMMKITGVLVDMLVQIDPNTYQDFVVYEKGRKVLYVEILRAVYGMLVASLLWYEKFRSDLEKEGFVFNDYDPCVANRIKRGKQHTIRFHVDDVMSSHVDPRVNDEFAEWLEKMYGQYKKVNPTRGKVHDYLGMVFDFSEPGTVIVDMKKYVETMLSEFPEEIKSTAETPAGESLLDTGKGKALDATKHKAYHTTVARGLFLCKRARPDIQPTIAVLSTRVKKPIETDWKKLVRMMKYLYGTKDKVLRLSADNLRVVKWYVDASFAVHPDFRSHTGGVMTFGGGAVQAISKKQKLNTRSSTEAELVAADDAATMILWTQAFMEGQGYRLDQNILYQDNKSAILLETNGRKSAGKRSRALNVRYFFLTDQVEKGNLSIEYCPTGMMWGDFMTKPLQGEKFIYFRNLLLGEKCEPAS